MFTRLRGIAFYFFYYLTMVWYGTTGGLLWWLPYQYRCRYITQWNRLIVLFARHILGVKVKVIGAENISNQACVIMSKHQSEFETFYLQTIFWPLCTILKKELLRLPFFGWALLQMEPIAIDRSSPKKALKQVQKVGLERISQGRSVLIFPEGTRVKPGEQMRYAKSGATLALAAEVDILPIAHNAGIYWQSRQQKMPGTITFVIGKSISTKGKTAKTLTQEVESWIEQQSSLLLESTAN